MCFALAPGTYLCPTLLAFLHDHFVLWLHGSSAYRPPTVLCLFSGSSARSPVFTLGAGWCLLHHIRYLAPHFPSRLSQAAGTVLCSFILLADPCSTSWEHILKVPNLQTHIFVATWKICFKHFDSSCRSRNIQHYTIRSQLPWAEPRPIHCITNIPNTSKAEDTKRKWGNPWGSTRLSTRCASFHCSILLPMERGRRGSYAGLSQQPWNSECSTLLCWTCEETPNSEQVTAAHRGTIWWGLLAIAAAVLKKVGIKEEIILEDGK